MADTSKLAYFPNSLDASTVVNTDFTTGCSKRDIAAIESAKAEYHIVFPQVSGPAIVVRFSTIAARNIAYSDFLKDYGNSITGS